VLQGGGWGGAAGGAAGEVLQGVAAEEVLAGGGRGGAREAAEEELAGAGRGGARRGEREVAVADRGEREWWRGEEEMGKTIRTGAPAGDEIDVVAVRPMFVVCSKK
jgi:hypothetical protein